MDSINGRTILYHGTKHFFESFDLSKAKPFKDFGRGFYLTSQYKQAFSWASGKKCDLCYLYEYSVVIPENSNLTILELTEYDKKWLDYISLNRTEDSTTADYDVVYDKLADSFFSKLPSIITKYRTGRISSTDAIKQLKWKRTSGDQYCFKTDRAVSCLKLLKCHCFKKNISGLYEEIELEPSDGNGEET